MCWEMRCHFRNYTQLFVINRRVPAGWAGWGWGIETKPRSKFNPFWVSGQSQKSPETSLATARKVGQDFLSGKRLPIPSLPTCKTSHFKHLKKAPRMGCSGTTIPRNGRVACISGRPQPSPAQPVSTLRVHPCSLPSLSNSIRWAAARSHRFSHTAVFPEQKDNLKGHVEGRGQSRRQGPQRSPHQEGRLGVPRLTS